MSPQPDPQDSRPATPRVARRTRQERDAAPPVPQAKLRPAVNPAHLVQRPRLHALLDATVAASLTLVVAPAGSGKTSLLRSWSEHSGLPCAWLALDESDADPVQLWLGIAAALETLAPGCSADAVVRLRRRGGLLPAVSALLDALEVRTYDAKVLVIDDLQLADDRVGARTLGIFLRNLPPWLHVVAASRRTPQLPLHRLRARGQLGEVHFPELRFSPDEAGGLLDRLAPGLTADRRAEIAARAGGWAAGIQLAALAARAESARTSGTTGTTGTARTSGPARPAGTADTAGPGAADIVRDADTSDTRTSTAFAGDEVAYLADYVWEEVLAGERRDVVGLLVATSVVDRIDPDLAQRLTGRSDARELLLLAEERGLFVARIEPSGEFQMHALVRDILVTHETWRDAEHVRTLHARAAAWYAENGHIIAALDHWLRAERPREALRLLASEVTSLYDTGRERTIRRTIAGIPSAVAVADLDAMLDFAWCILLVDRHRFLDSVAYATSWAAQDAALDPTRAARLLVLRSIVATVRGDWSRGARHAVKALHMLGPAWAVDDLGRFGWNMVAREIALAERWDDTGGEVRTAMKNLSVTPERRIAFEGTRALGEALAGRPVDALRVVAGARTAADVGSMTILRTELMLAEAVAMRELGDTAVATPALLALAEEPVEPVPYAQLLACLQLTQARLDSGDLDGAGELFGRAAEIVETELSGRGAQNWLAGTGAALALAADAHDDARTWTARLDDPFWSPLWSAKVLLAAGERAAAGDALKTAVPRCVRHRALRSLLLARTTADREEADRHLTSAVETAVAHGLVQTFASEGAATLDAVERLAWRVPDTWLDRLRRAVVPGDANAPAVALVETLTERELEVLRLLPTRLTLSEVADELFISRNTLKFHLKVVYRKLGCGSRAEAAAVARSMTSLRRSAQSSSARRR